MYVSSKQPTKCTTALKLCFQHKACSCLLSYLLKALSPSSLRENRLPSRCWSTRSFAGFLSSSKAAVSTQRACEGESTYPRDEPVDALRSASDERERDRECTQTGFMRRATPRLVQRCMLAHVSCLACSTQISGR